MKFNSFAFLCAVGLMVATNSAHAALDGLRNPYGSNPDISTDIYDVFGTDQDPSAALGIDTLPGSSSGERFTSTLTGAMTGGVLAGSGERIYNGVGPNSAAFNLSLDIEVLDSINFLTLQIRFTEPDGYTHGNFFTAELNGVSVDGVVTVSSGIGSTGTEPNIKDYGVVEFTWSNLNFEGGEFAEIFITSPAAGHASIDALRVDAVPEPSTYALLGAAGAVAMILRRRKLLASKA